MTSIYDIPYEDIEEFLLANNSRYDFKNDDEAYNTALILLKDKKSIGHTMSIIEWMMAHNLVMRKINISNYTVQEIDNMSQIKINQLAKLLTMNSNNVDNIKNILRFLHKLDDVTLLPEINSIILRNLNELEINDINFETLKLNDAINLLKTHHNKALIRKEMYNNIEKIILHNFFNIDFKNFNNLRYINVLTYLLPKYVILELIKYNEKTLLKNHTIEEIDSFLVFFEENERDAVWVDLLKNQKSLGDFLINLIEINECSLVKKVFDIIKKYKFKASINLTHH